MSEQNIPAHTHGLMNLRLYAVFAHATPGKDRTQMRDAHLAYMASLEDRGVLFAAGPLLDDDGKMSGSGLIILRARDLDDASAIAAADPYVKGGFRVAQVKSWMLMEGSIQLKMTFSNQRAAIV